MVEFMRVSDVFGRLSFVNELGNMLIRNSFEVPHETLPSTVSVYCKKKRSLWIKNELESILVKIFFGEKINRK